MNLFKVFLYSFVLCYSVNSFSFINPSLKKIAEFDGVVWSFDFIDDENLIFTIRSGKLGHYNLKSKKTKWLPIPAKVYTDGQGGLLDIKYYKGFVYLT